MNALLVRTLVVCMSALVATQAFAEDRVKAIVTKEYLYVGDSKGNMAVVKLGGKVPAKQFRIGARTVDGLPICWDITDADVIITQAREAVPGQVSVAVMRVPLKEAFSPPREVGLKDQSTIKASEEPKMTDVWVRGGPLSSAAAVAGFVSPPSAIFGDIFVDGRGNLLVAAQTQGQLLAEIVTAKTRGETTSSVKSEMSGPFVILPASDDPKGEGDIIYVDKEGRTYQSKDGKLVPRTAKQEPEGVEDDKVGDGKIVLVVDKRLNVPRCFRFVVDGKGTKLIDAAVDGGRRLTKDQSAEIVEALDRAFE